MFTLDMKLNWSSVKKVADGIGEVARLYGTSSFRDFTFSTKKASPAWPSFICKSTSSSLIAIST